MLELIAQWAADPALSHDSQINTAMQRVLNAAHAELTQLQGMSDAKNALVRSEVSETSRTSNELSEFLHGVSTNIGSKPPSNSGGLLLRGRNHSKESKVPVE